MDFLFPSYLSCQSFKRQTRILPLSMIHYLCFFHVSFTNYATHTLTTLCSGVQTGCESKLQTTAAACSRLCGQEDLHGCLPIPTRIRIRKPIRVRPWRRDRWVILGLVQFLSKSLNSIPSNVYTHLQNIKYKLKITKCIDYDYFTRRIF